MKEIIIKRSIKKDGSITDTLKIAGKGQKINETVQNKLNSLMGEIEKSLK